MKRLSDVVGVDENAQTRVFSWFCRTFSSAQPWHTYTMSADSCTLDCLRGMSCPASFVTASTSAPLSNLSILGPHRRSHVGHASSLDSRSVNEVLAHLQIVN